ncbi:LIC10124 family lipoprotein [Leptospira meyeri]|uniref:LIC10124 family lipoprotein n=1 Tax=Leptospira meyeri TaxID=29508 RepID=UPI000C2A6151|nr:PEGA domain-containing protein [Leptospira meyeri]PJZ81818.1 PEGA domain protein [Leptospira meyeri]PJZ97318.1 PEGA domain protein [Leptospira meyeri]
MRYVYLPVLCFLVGYCSSVTKIETLNRSFTKPKFITPLPGESEPLPSGRDYKERLVNKSTPHFSLLWKQVPEGFPKSDLLLLEEKVLFPHNKLGLYKKAPKDPDSKFSESSDLDLLLELTLTKNAERFSVEVQYKDPVLSQNYGKAMFVYQEEKEPVVKSLKTFDVFHGKRQLQPLTGSVPSYFAEISSPSDDDLRSYFTSSLRGNVSVFSTSPGTTIYLDGIEVGKAPLLSYQLINGKHSLSFAKPGKDPVKRNILIRAGKTTRVFQEWSDDISQGTIVISSFPPGLDIVVDGQKKGKTQYAESGVPYGSYPIQFVRTQNGSNFEYAKAGIKIRPKQITSIALPISLEDGVGWESEEFWNLTSASPNFSATFPGKLTFAKNKELPAGWYGVYSEDLIPDYLEAELVLDLVKDLNGAVGLSFTDHNQNTILVYVDKTDFHIIRFASEEKEAPVRSSYRWDKEDELKGRSVKLSTDIEKKLIRLSLGNKMVEELPWNFETFWNIGVLTPHNAPLTGTPLRGVKIRYPDMVKFEERLQK